MVLTIFGTQKEPQPLIYSLCSRLLKPRYHPFHPPGVHVIREGWCKMLSCCPHKLANGARMPLHAPLHFGAWPSSLINDVYQHLCIVCFGPSSSWVLPVPTARSFGFRKLVVGGLSCLIPSGAFPACAGGKCRAGRGPQLGGWHGRGERGCGKMIGPLPFSRGSIALWLDSAKTKVSNFGGWNPNKKNRL